MPLKLGTRVLVKGFLDRQADPCGFTWKELPCAPFEGIIVGKRTLWESEYDSEGWEYPHTEYLNHFAHPVEAYLVAPDLRSIRKVAPSQLEVIE